MEPTAPSLLPPLGLLEAPRILADLLRLSRDPAERLTQVHHLRHRAAETWLSLPDEAFDPAWDAGLGKATLGLAALIRSWDTSAPDPLLLARVQRALREEPCARSVCAALLFLPHLGVEADLLFPLAGKTLRIQLLSLLLASDPEPGAGDGTLECARLERLMDELLAWLPELAGEEREQVLQDIRAGHTLVPFYFHEWDVRRVAAKRARLVEAVYEWPGLRTTVELPAPIPEGRRIRVGILARSFDARSETYALLPVFEHLDRSRFETVLLAQHLTRTATEAHCAARADRALVLPQDLPGMAQAIRDLDLDLLLFGNNLSAGLSRVDPALGLHRLARIQVNFVCSPVSSGLPHVDAFLLGSECEAGEGWQARYSERPALIPGSGFCFSFAGRDETPGRIWKREDLAIRPGEVVFVSGANHLKLKDFVRDAWSRILAAVPGSVLVLYPFGPAWSQEYPQERFVASMLSHLDRHGVARDRLLVIGAMKNVQEIRGLLRCGDVYLDAFPYSGATSLQDPLDAGLPMVVTEGRELRFRQGAAILKEAGLGELVAAGPEAYLELAVRLGRERDFRQRMAAAVRSAVARGLPCRDGVAYAHKVATAFETLVLDWNAEHVERKGTAMASTSELAP